MKAVIYGIDEQSYRCAGCIYAKHMLDEAGITYEFKRIVKLDETGLPRTDKIILAELRDRIAVGVLMLPYIFIDNVRVENKDLSAFLENAGHDI